MANYPVQIVINAFDGVSKKFDHIRSKFSELEDASKKLKTSFKLLSGSLGLPKISSAIKGVGQGFAKVGQGAKESFIRLGAVAGAVFGGLFLLLKGTSERLDGIAKGAIRVGLSTDAFQELGYAAKLSGVNAEEFAAAMGKLSLNLGLARNKAGPLFSLLSKGAPKFFQELKGAKNNEQAFDVLARGIFKLKDPTKQAVLVTAAFGKAGMKLLPLFKEGPAGLKKLREEAKKLGIIKGADIEAASAFNDQLDSLGKTFEDLKVNALAPLFPVMTKLLGEFQAFIVDSLPDVRKFAEAFAADLPGYIDQLKLGFIDLKNNLKPLIEKGQWLVDKFGLFNVVAVALGAFIFGPFIAGLAALATSFITLGIALAPLLLQFGAFLLLNPLVWIAGLAAGAAYVITHWEKVWGWFDSFAKFLKNTFGFKLFPGLDKLKDKLPDDIKKNPYKTNKYFNPKTGVDGSLPFWERQRTAPEFGLGQPAPAKDLSFSPMAIDNQNRNELTIQIPNLPDGSKVKMTGDSNKDFMTKVFSGLQGIYSSP